MLYSMLDLITEMQEAQPQEYLPGSPKLQCLQCSQDDIDACAITYVTFSQEDFTEHVRHCPKLMFVHKEKYQDVAKSIASLAPFVVVATMGITRNPELITHLKPGSSEKLYNVLLDNYLVLPMYRRNNGSLAIYHARYIENSGYREYAGGQLIVCRFAPIAFFVLGRSYDYPKHINYGMGLIGMYNVRSIAKKAMINANMYDLEVACNEH